MFKYPILLSDQFNIRIPVYHMVIHTKKIERVQGDLFASLLLKKISNNKNYYNINYILNISNLLFTCSKKADTSFLSKLNSGKINCSSLLKRISFNVLQYYYNGNILRFIPNTTILITSIIQTL